MTVNAAETLVPGRLYFHVAPAGTAAPADESAALNVAFVNCGHTTPDATQIATEPEFQPVNSHQSDYPIDYIHVSETGSLSINLLQWNANNLRTAFGGGSVTEIGTSGSGKFKFSPAAIGGREEVTGILELFSGTHKYRWVIPRAMQMEGVTLEFQKANPTGLPVRLGFLGDDGVLPFYLLTDDPSFDPAP